MHGKKKVNHGTTLHVSWKWNYGGLKFMLDDAFRVLRMRHALFSFLIGCVG